MRVLLGLLLVGIAGCGGEGTSPGDVATPSSPANSPVKSENAAAGAPKTKPENVVAQPPQAKTKKPPVESKTALQGEWSVVSAKIGGTPTKAYDNQRFSFQGDQISQLIEEGKPPLASRFTLSAVSDSALPREFDWIQNGGKTYRGLLRISTDRLEFCVAQPGRPRPKTFEADGSLSIVLKKNAGNALKPGHKDGVASVGRGGSLDARSNRSSDAVVAALQKLKVRMKQDDQGNVVELLLLNTRITGPGLLRLSRLTQLRSLELNFIPVTDAGLEHLHLEELPNLQTLALPEQITDAGLVHLKGLVDDPQ